MEEEIEIEYYVTDNGKCPYEKWEDDLTTKVRAAIRSRLNHVRLGDFGDCKPIPDKKVKGVWELKMHLGPGYRIYYGKKGKKVVILLCAGEKKSQKRDIARAKEYWANYS